MNYEITEDCLTIFDSYTVRRRKDMKKELTSIYEDAISKGEDVSIFLNRSRKSMIAEWRAHNLLYDLHIFRSRTKDVDLIIVSKIVDIVYRIVSLFYFG